MKLSELEKWFEENPAPETPLRISVCEVATNPRRVVATHIAILKANPKNPTFLPYYDRLKRIYELTKSTNNGKYNKKDNLKAQ